MTRAYVSGLLLLTILLVATCQPTAPPSGGDDVAATATSSPVELTPEAAAPTADSEDTAVSPLATPDTGDGDDSVLSPLATPVVAEDLLVVPTPSSSEAGVVTGYLLGGETPKPAVGAILFLGNVVVGSDGRPVMASLDRDSSPRTLADPMGRFAFADVPPGSYAIILDLIASTLVMRDPVTGEDLLVEVVGGETIDIGELVYSSLPVLP